MTWNDIKQAATAKGWRAENRFGRERVVGVTVYGPRRFMSRRRVAIIEQDVTSNGVKVMVKLSQLERPLPGKCHWYITLAEPPYCLAIGWLEELMNRAKA